ncbi:MAG: sterol desaturase [Waddliaceae bacterium]|nr:sterol desaturase [Waddliaceae bacterium]
MDTLHSTANILNWGGLLLALLVLIETIVRQLRKENMSENWANIGVYITGKYIRSVLLNTYKLAIYFFIWSWVPYQMPFSWWSIPLILLIADFTYYWKHRAEHRIRLFWSFHIVHHSSEKFNLSTALRLPWLEGLIDWVFFVPALLVGVHPLAIMIAYSVVLHYQFWIHTEKIGKLGWMEKVFNTPSLHRVHHGSNPQYLDKNYAGILIIWDRIFGSYQEEIEPVRFGVTKPIETQNPLMINFGEPIAVAKQMSEAPDWPTALAVVYKGPEWEMPKHKTVYEPNDLIDTV